MQTVVIACLVRARDSWNTKVEKIDVKRCNK